MSPSDPNRVEVNGITVSASGREIGRLTSIGQSSSSYQSPGVYIEEVPVRFTGTLTQPSFSSVDDSINISISIPAEQIEANRPTGVSIQQMAEHIQNAIQESMRQQLERYIGEPNTPTIRDRVLEDLQTYHGISMGASVARGPEETDGQFRERIEAQWRTGIQEEQPLSTKITVIVEMEYEDKKVVKTISADACQIDEQRQHRPIYSMGLAPPVYFETDRNNQATITLNNYISKVETFPLVKEKEPSILDPISDRLVSIFEELNALKE